MQFYLLILHLFSVAVLIALVLIQQGKGADMGAAFGSGASGSLFGASGGANVLSRATAVLAAVFFICTLALAGLGNQGTRSSGSVLETSVLPSTAASGASASAVASSAAQAATSSAKTGIPNQ